MSMLRRRQIIPALSLQTHEGRTIRAWDFKQKKNLVIAFLDAQCPACEDFLEQLVERAAELADREAVVLIVFPDSARLASAKALPPQIIAGRDVSGSSRRFLGEEPVPGGSARGVFTTDRYGELSAIWAPPQRTSGAHGLPAVDEILAALDHIQIACEECYMPHWPPDA
jgi:hypothetical protein